LVLDKSAQVMTTMRRNRYLSPYVTVNHKSR